MNFVDFYSSEPMRYWQPAKEKHIELDIIENPLKYSDYIAAYKRDGEWARMLVDENREVTFQSRSISKVTGTYGDKTALLPHLVKYIKEHKELFPNNSVFLGELCFYEDLHKISTDVGSILRCKEQKAISRQQENGFLSYYIFDCLCYNNVDITAEPFEKRIKYFPNESQYIKVARYTTVDQVAEEYSQYLAMGGEGYVLMRKDATYDPGTRTSWKSIKLKKATQELELPVVGLVEPKKDYNGKEIDEWEYWIEEDGIRIPVTKKYYNNWKAGVVVKNASNTLVKITSGVSDDDAEWLSTDDAATLIKNNQLYAVVNAMQVTEDGSLRHPYLIRLRQDL